MDVRSLPCRYFLAALVFVTALSGCASLQSDVEPPRVTLAGLRVVDMNWLEQRFEATLRVQNTNRFALPVTGMDYALTLNGESFAQGVNNESVSIPAYGEELMRVTITSSLIDNVAQLHRWRRDPPKTLDYRLTGRLSLANALFRLPFEHGGSVDLAEMLPR